MFLFYLANLITKTTKLYLRGQTSTTADLHDLWLTSEVEVRCDAEVLCYVTLLLLIQQYLCVHFQKMPRDTLSSAVRDVAVSNRTSYFVLHFTEFSKLFFEEKNFILFDNYPKRVATCMVSHGILLVTG